LKRNSHTCPEAFSKSNPISSLVSRLPKMNKNVVRRTDTELKTVQGTKIMFSM